MAGLANSERIDLSREAPFKLGELAARPAAREIVCGARREILEPRVMQVLTTLARHRGEIVTRDELITACWEGRMVGDDAINRCIARLRRLAEAFGGFSLETVPRVGYRLTAESQRDQATEEPALVTPGRSGRIWLGIAGALLGVLLLVIAVKMWHSPMKEMLVGPPEKHLIAVLPFTPQSPGADAGLLGDRVAASVAETLAKTGQPVVPFADGLAYRGDAKARAARELNAMYVVDGEVVREQGRVRVTVHFDDAIRGTTVFANTFEDSVDRAGDLPDRVASYIASVSWGSDITRWNRKIAPAMLRSFEQHKRGDLFAAYETARALAETYPNDAEVQRTSASAAVNLIYDSQATRTQKYLSEARRAALRSLDLEPCGEAYAVLASVTPHFLWAEREAHLRKALTISPESVGLAEYLTWLLDDTGRFRDADAFARSAYERFPYHTYSLERRAGQLLGTGDAAGALEIFPRARRLWPGESVFFDLQFEAVALQRRPPVAASTFLDDRDVRASVPPTRLALWKAIVRARQHGRQSDVAALVRTCGEAGENWWSCMAALSLAGQTDAAFLVAGKAYPDQRATGREALVAKWLANPEPLSTRYLLIPATAAMRADPRFRGIAERTGLLQYWQATHHAPDFCAAEKAPVCALLK